MARRGAVNIDQRYSKPYRLRREREAKKAYQENRPFDLKQARGHKAAPVQEKPKVTAAPRISTKELLNQVQQWNPKFDDDLFDEMVEEHGTRIVRTRLQRLIRNHRIWEDGFLEEPEGGPDDQWSRELGSADISIKPWWWYH